MKIDGFENVFYDQNSEFAIDSLNERFYVSAVLAQLNLLLLTDSIKYNYYIFSHSNPLALPDARNDQRANKILIHLSEESGCTPGSWGKEFVFIFKAYLKHDSPELGFFCFPVGCTNEIFHLEKIDVNRTIDVFFSGNLNRKRIPLLKALNGMFKVFPDLLIYMGWRLANNIFGDFAYQQTGKFPAGIVLFNSKFKGGLDPNAYWNLLCASKIVFCPSGFISSQTFRHFEALKAGAVVISEVLPSNYLYHDSPIIQVRNWNEGIDIALGLLLKPDRIHLLSVQSRNWWKSVLRPEAVAKWMANILVNRY